MRSVQRIALGKDKGKDRKSRLHKTLPRTGGAGLCPATDSDCFSEDASYITERLRNQVQFTIRFQNFGSRFQMRPQSGARSCPTTILLTSAQRPTHGCLALRCKSPTAHQPHTDSIPTAYQQHTNSIHNSILYFPHSRGNLCGGGNGQQRWLPHVLNK